MGHECVVVAAKMWRWKLERQWTICGGCFTGCACFFVWCLLLMLLNQSVDQLSRLAAAFLPFLVTVMKPVDETSQVKCHMNGKIQHIWQIVG